MLAELISWWLGQMRSLLPGVARARDALIFGLEPLGETPQGGLWLRRDGVETRLGDWHAARAPELAAPPGVTGLRLPDHLLISRRIELPLAAAGDVAGAIGYELDRLTPFGADEIYWSLSGVTTDRERGKLEVALSIVPRAVVAPVLGVLAGWHLAPSFMENAQGRVDLVPVRKARGYYGEALCAGLVLACVAVPFVRQQIALGRAEQAIAANAEAARTAQGMRDRLVMAASARAAMAEARRSGEALQVVAALTDALPDGAWLSDLNLKPGDLAIDGHADNAAQLITRLASVPGLRDPSFTAPVTRTADGGSDLFSLHMTVAP